jgi:hypothetical protein
MLELNTFKKNASKCNHSNAMILGLWQRHGALKEATHINFSKTSWITLANRFSESMEIQFYMR